jgi:hypothetical protein
MFRANARRDLNGGLERGAGAGWREGLERGPTLHKTGKERMMSRKRKITTTTEEEEPKDREPDQTLIRERAGGLRNVTGDGTRGEGIGLFQRRRLIRAVSSLGIRGGEKPRPRSGGGGLGRPGRF